jgi:hypothetical protein
MSFVVVALAVALRVAWVLAIPSKPVGDFAMYVEAAAYFVEHGGFDPEYVYMPGYIFLIAPVQALGGGWLATKLVGAVLGGLGAGAVVGIARRISGGSNRVALVAGLLYALWPAGIAVCSVTGTDMPAAVLVVIAAYFLFRFSGQRPILAAILFGVFTGFAAYIRAIVVPLAALSALVFRASGKPWRTSLASAAIACAVALLMLSPWAVRNRLRYGETFFTDSHGGLTALVGANPNTDGCYSRSLNRMFHDVTGFAFLSEPHREADRRALAVAKTWITYDPLFTLGSLASKAERLLVHERALLYWPLFRAGVLPEPYRGFFSRHQGAIEWVADNFWLAVLALALMGCGLAWARKQWLALSLLPAAAVLIALYTAIFSEQRYRLPICMLLLPLSALAIEWISCTARDLRRGALAPACKREVALATGVAAFFFAAGPALAWAGAKLRERHGWAVTECTVAGRPHFCKWRTVSSEGSLAGRPGVKGVWNGLGIALPSANPGNPTGITVETDLPLAAGDYTLGAAFDIAPLHPRSAGTIAFLGNGQPLPPEVSLAEVAELSREGQPYAWSTTVHHGGGPLRFRAQLHAQPSSPDTPVGRIWLSGLEARAGTMDSGPKRE